MALSWDSFDNSIPIAPATPKVLGPEDFYPLIDEISTTHGVDPRLVRSMVKTESNFDPKATSKAGAKGLLQLMDPTAKELGVVDSFNPRQNLDGGVRYIKKLMDMYGGDQEKALAAYNFGMGNVANGLEYPQETRDYITKVMAGIAPVEGQVPKPQPSMTWDSFDGEAHSQGGAGNILGAIKTGAKMVGQSAVESTTPVVPTGKLPLGIPSSPNKMAQGVLDVAYGVPEAGAALASGAASFLGGQVGGLAALPRDEKSLAKAFDIAEKVNEAGMYQPVTNTGQLLLKPIETAFGTFLGTVDKVARATAPEGASEEDLETRSKAWQYIANTALLGAPMAVSGARRAARAVRKGKVEVTPEVLESAKAKVLADPKVPDSVKIQAAATPLDKIAEQINKGQARARVDKISGPAPKFEGNADVLSELRLEAEMAQGGSKRGYNNAVKIVAELGEDIGTVDYRAIKGIGPKTSAKIHEVLERRKMAEGTGEVPEFSAPAPAVESPILPTGTRAEVPVRKSSVAPTESLPIQEVLDSLEPGITYQRSSKLGEFETHQFITSEGRNFSSLSLEPEEVRTRYEKVKEGFEPKVEETPTPVTEVITPEFDSVGIAKEEGYEFPGKKRYSSFEDAHADASSRGDNFEVVKIGEKYRVGKYAEEAPRGEYVPEVVETSEARRVFELAKEEEARKKAEGASEVDDLYSDGVTVEDWKVLEEITQGVNLEEIRLGEEVVAEVKAAKEAIPPEVPKGRTVDSASAAKKFLEWRDSYVTKRNVATPASWGGKTPLITKEALPLVDDKFAIFDKLEDAEAFRDAKGTDREIIRDPATGKYFLEPELELLDKADMWDLGEKEYLEESYGRESGLGDEVLDYGERGDGAGRDLWSIMNNERGSVDVTSLRVAVDQIENVVKMAKKVGKSIDDYLSSMGVDQASIELFKASLANVGQMKQEIKEADPLGSSILRPEGKIVSHRVKKSGGKVVAHHVPITEELANRVLSAPQKANWGNTVTTISPAGKIVSEYKLGSTQKYMQDTEIKINAFRSAGLTDLYRNFRDSKALAKSRATEGKKWVRELKGQIDPERYNNYAIDSYSGMKSVDESFERLGIKGAEPLTPKEGMIQQETRVFMEKIIDEINYVRINTGLKPIPKLRDKYGRVNYLPLVRNANVLRDMGVVENFSSMSDARIGELSKTFNGMFNPHSKKRNVSDIPIELDPFKAIERYLDYAYDEIHLSPVAALAKELAVAKLPLKNTGKKVTLMEVNPGLATMLLTWSEHVMGKDPVAMALASRNKLISKSISGVDSVGSKLTAAIIGGSLRTVAIQPTSYIIGVPAMLDLPSTAYGIGKLMVDRVRGKRSEGYDKPGVLGIRNAGPEYEALVDYMQRGLLKGWRQVATEKSLMPMKWVDKIVAEMSWNAGKYYAEKRLKLKGEDARNFAEDVVERTQGLGIKGSLSNIQSSAATKWLTVLQTFAITDFNLIARDILGIKNPDVNSRKTVLRVIKYVAATQLIGMLYKSIGLENVVPDPVGAYMNAKEEGSTDTRAVLEASKELLEKFPILGGAVKYGSSLGGPVFEWAKLVPTAISDVVKLTDWNNLTGKERDKMIYNVSRAVGYTMGIPLTNQILKSIKAADRGGNPYQVIMGVYEKEKSSKRGSRRARRRGLPSSF